MKNSQTLVKFIKIATLLGVALGVIIPAVTSLCSKLGHQSELWAQRYFSLDTPSITMDQMYAHNISQSLITCINQYVANNTLLSFKTEELYTLLKKRYDVIKEFDCRIQVPTTITVHLAGIKPYCVINNSHVLGETNNVLPLSFFADFDSNKIPSITIDAQLFKNITRHKKLPENLFMFLHTISEKSWDSFFISYQSPSHLELTPRKANYHFTMIVDENSFPFNGLEDSKVKTLEAMYDDIIKKNYLQQKTLIKQNPHITFDMRFNQRVVVKSKDDFNKRGTGL